MNTHSRIVVEIPSQFLTIFLALDFAVEATDLFRQREQEKDEPGLPAQRLGPDRSLGLP